MSQLHPFAIHSSAKRRWLRRHRVAVALLGSVGLGWLATLLVASLPSSGSLLPVVVLPISYVPAALAWAVMRVTGTASARMAFRARLTRVRVGWRQYAIAALGLPALYLMGVGLAALFGGSFVLHPGLLVLLPLFFLTNFGEEAGWRGFAIAELQRRYSPLAAALIVGLAWAAFHWIALLANRDAPLAYAAIGTAQLVAFSVLLSALFNAGAQSVPLIAFAHAMYDTIAIGVSPLAATGVPLLAFSLTAIVAWLAVAILVARTGASLGWSPRRAAAPGDVRTPTGQMAGSPTNAVS